MSPPQPMPERITSPAPSSVVSSAEDSELPPPSPLFSAQDDELSDTDGAPDGPIDPAMLGSPAPSVYSLTESLIANSIKREHGRDLQNHSDIYSLPADNPEFERLNKQHYMFTLVLGKYPAPIFDVLREDPDPDAPQKAVLDLGCGTGAWLADVATDFPHVEAVGVDLVPPQITYAPPNVRAEIDDINLGLEHFFGAFDVVHTRLICAGIKDYAGLVDQISRILRPDGLAILGECDFRIYTDKPDGTGFETFDLTRGSGSSGKTSQQPTPPAETPPSQPAGTDPILQPPVGKSHTKVPAIAYFVNHMRNCARARGGHLDAAMLLHRWVSQHRAFKNIVSRDVYFPLSPFAKGNSDEARRQRRIGKIAAEDTLAFLSSGRLLCLKGGLPEETVDSLLEAAQNEIKEAKIPVYLRMQCVYARRK